MFPGINPFLNTYLKQRREWPEFHGAYITFLLLALRAALLPRGYRVVSEKGLQIKLNDLVAYPVPDVLVTDPAGRARVASTPESTQADAVLDVTDVVEFGEVDDYLAVKIYAPDAEEPLVWIEVLSPSNKPPHADFGAYQTKRQRVLKAGTVFIELDFVHWLPPTLSAIPAYASDADHAKPYHITVVDPHPEFRSGKVYFYTVGVLDPLPQVAFPLAEREWFTFDFGAPYRKTVAEGLYEQFVGAELDGYHAADAEKIREFVAEEQA